MSLLSRGRWRTISRIKSAQGDRVNFSRCCALRNLLLVSVLLGLMLFTPDRSRAAKVRVRDAGVAQQLIQSGARLIADYGAFQYLEVPEAAGAARPAPTAAATPSPASPAAKVEDRDEENFILLNAARLDTRAPAAMALRQQSTVAPFVGRRMHLVQFAGPPKPEWVAWLKGTGAEIVAYIPHHAYLVYGDAPALQQIQAGATIAPFVQWEGTYRDEFRVDPTVQATTLFGQPHPQAGDWFAVQMVADPLANAATLALVDAHKLAPAKQQDRVLNCVNVVVRLTPRGVAELAARPDVISIQPYVIPSKRDERQNQIVAGNLIGNEPAGPGYLAWLTGKGFNQAQFSTSGFAVDVTDSGIDNATQQPGHFGLYQLGQTNLASRVIYNRLEGTPHVGSTLQGCDGHGTINAHIIAGFNDLTGFPHSDAAGFRYGLGVCPFVKVGSSVIFDPDSYTFPDFEDLQSKAYQDGARLSANSWGANTAGAYNADSQRYDALVRDAQPAGSTFPAPGNQEMVIIFAAGNAGSGAQTVGSPGTGKNVFTIGAAENVHSHSSTNGGNNAAGNDGCNTSDAGANSANDIIGFSSRGPCADGRQKPDIVAPGTHITGGVAQETAPGPLGTAIACFAGTGVCALPGGGTTGNGNNFFPLGQQFYTTSSGTSHSTPAVAGGAALLRQWFLNQGRNAPSPAMTKAFLMNAARYLTGVSANDTLPSPNQGMGGMNLGTAFDDTPRRLRDQLDEDRFTGTGQSRVFGGAIRDPSRPFRVTLAWTDAPGSTTGAAYNNNLDLEVTVGGQTYRGNVFSGAWSTTGGTADVRNNVESVFLPAGTTGEFTVTVTATSINSDGVPNNADPLDQDFALVIYNEAQILGAGATVVGESCSPANGAVDPGELVTVSFGLRNMGLTAVTNLMATLLPGNGVAAPGAPQSYNLPTGGVVVTNSFTFRGDGECGDVITATLQLQDGTNDLGIVSFNLTLGGEALGYFVFTNNAPLTVPAGSPAQTYPSTLSVSNVPGNWQRVIVTLTNLMTDYANDLDFLLVGPQGQKLMIMSDAFGPSSLAGTVILDDLATNALPTAYLDGLGGRFRPTDHEPGETLPAPAPSPPYATNLAAFAGNDANGDWQLYVASDENFAASTLGGWSLTFVVPGAGCCLDTNAANLAVSLLAAPNPVFVGSNVTLTLEVTNKGPADATGVQLTNFLPAGLAFLGASNSQGSVSHSAGEVVCALGALPAGSNATVVITAMTVGNGALTNRAIVGADQFDFASTNNTTLAVITVTAPAVSVSDATVAEGDSGVTNAVFTVLLSAPTVVTQEVAFATVSGSALAGEDFIATNGTLVFLPGQTSQVVVVSVLGDVLFELNETFTLELSAPVNATLADAQGIGTILNDDALPALAIADVTLAEGNTGTNWFLFEVSLTPASGAGASVNFTTTNGTAAAGADYVATNGTLVFAPGVTQQVIAVAVRGDVTNELDETFFVNLTSPVNATNLDAQATGTVLNDDLLPNLVAAGSTVAADACNTNGFLDPGEAVTVRFGLRNLALNVATTNLVATLLPGGGVGAPGAPQNYGVLTPGGPAVTNAFTFTAQGVCGGSVTATLQLQDGAMALGTVSFTLPIGAVRVALAENFDGVSAGTLPAGWSNSFTGSTTPWTTQSAVSDTPPNAAFAPDVSVTSDNLLTSPAFSITQPDATLVFRHRYITEAGYDGGLLLISLDGGPFSEWTAAGGGFITNGYNSSISGFAGAWNGNSGGFITTVARLPFAAAGRSVRLRWRLVTDSSVGGTGWHVDSITVFDGIECCNSPGALDRFEWTLIPTPQYATQPFLVGITGRDAFGGVATSFDGTAGLSAQLAPVFEARFESGLDGFTVDNTFGSGGGLWRRSTGRGLQAGHSPSNSLYYGTNETANGGGNYNTGNNEGVVISPLINLAGLNPPLSLHFNYLLQTEGNTSYDFALVEISTNNGATYTVLANANNPAGPLANNTGGSWRAATLDLTPYLGQSIRLRFRFDTVDALVNDREGWYLDDILVRQTAPPGLLAPAGTGPFAAGGWVGALTVATPATNVTLLAADELGRRGETLLGAVLPWVDTDGDGTPDPWENQFALNPNVPDALQDADGDGFTNLQEFLAGTNPLQADSAIRILSVHESGSDAVVTFTTVAGRFYRLERLDELPGGEWTLVTQNIPGTGLSVQATDPGAAGQPRRFYRIKTQP
jgi:uncharacterized repeat protein (TIGR01451 family)